MADGSYVPKVYNQQGGDRMVVASGGSVDVESGGEIDIESGGSLKIGGTAITATAAELNAHAAQSSGVAYETVAAAGNAQGNATAMSADFVLVTAADGAKGVILPVPVAGRQLIVKNNVAAALLVYPNTGGAINAIAANTQISMGNLTSAVFVASSATQWFTVPLLPS